MYWKNWMSLNNHPPIMLQKQVSELHLVNNSAEGEKSSTNFQGVINCIKEFYEKWKVQINAAMTKTVAFMKGGKLRRNHEQR
jgi:hypothetical protein